MLVTIPVLFTVERFFLRLIAKVMHKKYKTHYGEADLVY